MIIFSTQLVLDKIFRSSGCDYYYTEKKRPTENKQHYASSSSPSDAAGDPSLSHTAQALAVVLDGSTTALSQKMRVSQPCRCKIAHSRHASQSHSRQENIRLPAGHFLSHQLQMVSSTGATHDRRPWCPAQLKLSGSRPGPGTQNWSHSRKDITPDEKKRSVAR